MGNLFELIKVEKEFSTSTHEVMVGKVKIGEVELTVDMLRSFKMQGRGDFIPAAVKDATGKTLWTFKEESFRGLAKLFIVGQELVIGLVSPANVLNKVLPVSDLPKSISAKMGDQIVRIGGSDISSLYRLKVKLAKREGLQVVISEAEKKVAKEIDELEKKVAAEKFMEEERRRKERIDTVLARPKVTVYTIEGKRLFGYPVVGDEYALLPDNSDVILVSSYGGQAGTCGDPLEAFFVRKSQGGRVNKFSVKTGLSYNPPIMEKEKTQPTPKILEYRAFQLDKCIITAPVVAKEDFKTVRGILNSGTIIAVRDEERGKFIVYTLKGNGADPLGEAPIQ